MSQRTDRIRERLDDLAERVTPLADLVRQHAQRARAELRGYPQAKATALDILKQASLHQSRAMSAARRLAVYQMALADLLGQIQLAEQLGVDPAALADLKRDLRRLERSITQWSSPPAGDEVGEPSNQGE